MLGESSLEPHIKINVAVARAKKHFDPPMYLKFKLLILFIVFPFPELAPVPDPRAFTRVIASQSLSEPGERSD